MATKSFGIFNRLFSRSKRRESFPFTRFARLRYQVLEDRMTPSVYLVHTSVDNGSNVAPTPGSLREAINYVNGGLHDEIQFDMFFTPGATKISVPTPLPPLAVFAKVGGGTMPGMLPMEINGSALGGGSGLTFTAGGTLKGVSITGFPEFGVNVVGGIVSIDSCTIGINLAGTTPVANKGGGIALASAGNAVKSSVISANGKDGISILGPGGNLITGNTIGLNPTGTAPAANSASGIKIDNSPGNTIGGAGGLGNIIAGNAANGILVAGSMSTSTIIKGNILGNAVAGNTLDGILVIDAPSTIIGGKAAGEGNVIANNKSNGVQLMAAGGLTPSDPGALVEGNFIGTNAAGTADLGNKFDGIRIAGLHNNNIGGTAAGAGNLISGNDAVGINVGSGNKNTVQGNNIGLNLAGSAAIPNTVAGVAIASASNTIGGPAAGARNLISGNAGVGVILSGAAAMGNTVAGNWIGLAADGVTAAGNKTYGILVNGDASKNFIGGTASGAGNTIAFNGETNKLKGHGIVVASGTENAIRRNSIFENFGRAIDLGSKDAADGPNLNDRGGDADSGANGLQDYPVAISRPVGPASLGETTWLLESTPNTAFVVEFYSNDKVDKSGWGEGQTYLGDMTVTTDADGCVEFTSTYAGKSLIAATATDPSGNTSEFSLIDTDADALADAWESTGIDINEDETIDLVLSSNPNHRDLFVEVDAMVDLSNASRATKINAGLTLVTSAFAAAPDSAIHNPDQVNGIALHAVVDEDNLTSVALNNGLDDVRSIRNGTGNGSNGRFGSATDRGSGNWVNIRDARNLVYRYCLFGETGKLNGQNAQGAAELPGTNFFVALPDNILGGITADDRAGVFMHELGHTLGLHHGGDDDVNYKPNYYSVMNYTWAIPNVLSRVTGGVLPSYYGSKVLDYSRSVLSPVNENNLNETTSLGGPGGTFVPTELTPYGLVSFGGNPDFNRDGDSFDNGFSRDVNMDGDSNAVLTGHEDWSKLLYYLSENRCDIAPPEDEGDPIGELPPTPLDFGDAPDPTYPTLLANDGARHMMSPDLYLGAQRDSESNGQPNATANGDDTIGMPDDEDGVIIPAFVEVGHGGSVTVTASKAGLLDAWVDFNNDGDWNDNGEQVATTLAVAAGSNTVNFSVPLSAVSATTYARFRLSSVGGLLPTGLAYDGEVEDYRVTVQLPAPPTVTGVVFGDGTNQRSTVRRVVVTFSEAVNFSPSVASAFTLHRSGTGGTIGDVTLTANPATGPTSSVTITFSGSLTESNGSLVDGLYDLILSAAQVSGIGGLLDGNYDTLPGGSYSVTGTTANQHYRLFGDDNGDGTVSQVDYNAFRLSFLAGPNVEFDFDNDGQVSQPDYNAFRLRFLGTP